MRSVFKSSLTINLMSKKCETRYTVSEVHTLHKKKDQETCEHREDLILSSSAGSFGLLSLFAGARVGPNIGRRERGVARVEVVGLRHADRRHRRGRCRLQQTVRVAPTERRQAAVQVVRALHAVLAARDAHHRVRPFYGICID